MDGRPNIVLVHGASDTHYLRTADTYLRALQRRRAAGLDLAVPSVASVFISRWDSAADPLLPPALHWAALLTAIEEKAQKLTSEASQ
jgi:hypothetical protein